MAIQFPNTGDGLQRTAGSFLSGSANFTIMFWMFSVGDPLVENPDYRAYHVLANVDYSQYLGLYSVGDLAQFALTADVGGGAVSSDGIPQLPYDAYHICYVYDNTAKTVKLYVNKYLADTISIDFASTTFAHDYLGYDGFSVEGPAIQNYRSWQRALTIAQIETESISDSAVLATNLFCDTPLSTAADLADDSGNARDWSNVATPSNYIVNDLKYEPNTNQADTTAFEIPFITEAGYRLTQDAIDGTVKYLWFKYTAVSGDNVIGIRIYGDNNLYKPTLNVFTGTPGSLVTFITLSGTTYKNTPIQIAIVAGTTYYFRATYNSGITTEAPLVLQFTKFPDVALSDGDYIITDDTGNELPLSYWDGTTGELKGFIQQIASGEYGDSLETTPVYLLSDENSASGTEIILYDQFFVEITRFLISASGIIIRANIALDIFHVFHQYSLFGSCYSIEPDGTLTLLTSDVIVPANQRIEAICTSLDGTLLYYVGRDTLPPGDGLITDVHCWNLDTNSQENDVFPSVAADDWRIFDMLTAADDTLILCLYRFTDSSVNVINVDPTDGSVLHTYALGTNNSFPGGGTAPRLSRDPADTHFRVMRHTETPAGNTLIQRVKISDGTVTDLSTHPEYELAIYQPDDSLGSYAPVAAFGNSYSCPLVLAILTTTPGTGTLIVNKVKVSGPDGDSFAFTTSGGLSPSTFSLEDEETQVFDNLTPGTFGITETADPNYSTAYNVSNGDPHGSINVGADEIITVTVTNTYIGVNSLSGIYQLVPDKRNDTLWISFDPEETEDVEIPSPFFKTALFGK